MSNEPSSLYGAGITHLRQILQNEVQTPAPHLCARHVSTFHIYSTIAQLAAIYPDNAIIQEALDIFKTLLDSEEGDFLKDKAFADALSGFISTISATALPVETESAAVEVLFAITAKLRLQSELLLTWFRPNKKGWAFQSENQQARKGKEEFPLFYMILDYVYHDGRTGDFARTGLLYLIEAASQSTALEQWVIESDLATLMASGLGALYSQLTRYPSLIESSDRDGGSSVAVLTYLKCIIESIDHPELADMILTYLLAIPDARREEKPVTRPTALARRRRSQSLVASLSQGQEKPLPDLFNLDDLVLGSLRSSNQQTVVATLRLITTMLRSHHQSDVSLIKTGGRAPPHPLRAFATHEMNISSLYRIVEDLMEWPDLGIAYEIHLEDAQNTLEAHPCSLRLLDLSNAGHRAHGPVVPKAKVVNKGSKPFNDPILGSLLALLDDFFLNEIDTNISLTNVFSTIACCPERSLDEWLLNKYAKPSSSEGHSQAAVSSGIGETAESDAKDVNGEDGRKVSDNPDRSLDRTETTPVFSSLDSLVKQVEAFRKDVENFDLYLAERRHVFQVGDEVEKFVQEDLVRARTSEDRNPGSHSQLKNGIHIGSISERLMSETSTNSSSGANSPRGRQQQSTSTSALSGKLSHLRISPLRSRSNTGRRNISPSPLRQEVSASNVVQQSDSSIELADRLNQKLRIRSKRESDQNISEARSDTSSIRSEPATIELPTEHFRDVSLSHILTNVIILQEFVLELVAIIQVRASLFGEVKFD
ncbi:uncharacterized protein KY384_003054 [Bacidia gigantensis]|uniref:uncharacterized protein n=1 Tax=Bacidia gigantensis TaxID=2732470 RepID=UPI001D04A2B1|nr:uncharacterized protein KY384_003054 [Bacidia gigantensis]KAG8531425.1 hypothetical protein KY384_003054 [Bacidia gigantensis]